MEISRRMLTVLCVIGVVALVFAVIKVNERQNAAQHHTVTDANKNCRRASERTALAAAFIFAEKFSHPEGDTTLNDGYAQGLIETIPTPPGHKHDPTVVDVVRVENQRHVVVYRPTAEAKALQKAGCDRLFPPT